MCYIQSIGCDMVCVLLCALLWRGLHCACGVAELFVQYILLGYGVGSFRTLQAPIRLRHALLAVYDAQQLRSLHRTYDRMLGNLHTTQIEHTASMEHLHNYNSNNLRRLIPSLGASTKNTACKVVRIWYEIRKIALVIIQP